MLLHKFTTGDEVHRFPKSIVVKFNEDRKVLSTSHINGGYREDLESVFNFDSNPEEGKVYCHRTDTYEQELKLVASELGLDPEKTAGISTAVSMKNVSIKSNTYEDLTVTAIVTGGIEINGGRVGDPAIFHERKEQTNVIKPGTINIILYIEADMPPGTIARTMVTCTEAKTVAVQELMSRSMFSRGLATGSGTDETIIICKSKAKNQLTFAGKHSKLGELIGLTVISAVKEALYLQTGLCPERQHSVFKRLDRFGVNEQRVWEKVNQLYKGANGLSENKLMSEIRVLEQKPDLVTLASLYAHLLDQLDWQLLSPKEVEEAAKDILHRIQEKYNVECNYHIRNYSREDTVTVMIDNFTLLFAIIVLHSQGK